MSCPPAHHLNLRGSARERCKTTKNNFKKIKEKKYFHYKQMFLRIIRSKFNSITFYFFHREIDFASCSSSIFPSLIPSVRENILYNNCFFIV